MKKEQLEKQVLLSRGKWQFDRQVAAIFDRHIRRSVPLYDELHRMIVELAEPFLSPNAVVCDLGTSTGEAVFNLNKHYQKLELCYYAVDNSPAMLAKAREKCQAVKKVNFICSDLSDFSPPESDLIISLYTLQFVKPRERKLIQKKIFRALKKPGAFILAEKIANPDSPLDKLFKLGHEKMKQRKGFSAKEIAAKKSKLQDIMHPVTYAENYQLLKESGFCVIETFFHWYNFIGLIALK